MRQNCARFPQPSDTLYGPPVTETQIDREEFVLIDAKSRECGYVHNAIFDVDWDETSSTWMPVSVQWQVGMFDSSHGASYRDPDDADIWAMFERGFYRAGLQYTELDEDGAENADFACGEI